MAPLPSSGRWLSIPLCAPFGLLVVLSGLLGVVLAGTLLAQNASTGALAGTVSDTTGAVLPGTQIALTSESTRETRSAIAQSDGRYAVPLLSPGSYTIKFMREGFKSMIYKGIQVRVTETTRLSVELAVGQVSEQVFVSGDAPIVQTESAAMGHVVGEDAVTTLPLVTRNYTQILGLSPGVNMQVTNAAELGRGSGGSQGDTDGAKHVNGGMQYDNDFEMNGIQVNDAVGYGIRFSGVDGSGGVPIPNPDTIQEFKVQTGQYDAEFGRNAGAQVEIVTKGGSNQFHGTFFEFFRNEALNANDFFRKLASQEKAQLREHQFGFTAGGPVKKETLLFFVSYQRTQQTNGVAPECSSTVVLPPLTNDRSPAALGTLFAGQHGALDFTNSGASILQNGSNINPVALRLLQMRLKSGEYLIPTPQVVNPNLPFLQQGFSAFSQPCAFEENQFMTNADYLQSGNNTFHGRFFFADSPQVTTFADSNVPTLPFSASSKYRNVSLAHTHVFTPRLLNDAIFGYNVTDVSQRGSSLFSWSSVGVTVPSQGDGIPILGIQGSLSFGSEPATEIAQNSYNFKNTLVSARGAYTLRLGVAFTYNLIDRSRPTQFASLEFLSFPDFLLGLPGGSEGSGGNGTPFSNVSSSLNFTLLNNRRFRAWHGALFAQDDFRIGRRLTLNLGLRYEHIGDLVDRLGRISNFDITTADSNPPDGGSLQGFVVASNYSGGVLPAGVVKTGNDYGIKGNDQNVFAPRVGFAWDLLPKPGRLVVRGGYGIYFTQPPGYAFFFSVLSQPWSANQHNLGTFTPSISFQEPFIPPLASPSSLPKFQPYSGNTALSGISTIDQNYRPGYTQQVSFNLQSELTTNLALELGYVGSRGQHIIEVINPNQAGLASAQEPIRGITTNEVSNIGRRVRVLGFTPTGISLFRSEGASWYHALQASLNKRVGRGLQFRLSYTLSKSLSTAGANTESAAEGTPVVGNQLDPSSRYGRSDFDRRHRLVFSYMYQLPAVGRSRLARFALRGWEVGGVTTVQSGRALTVTATNPNNAYGITNNLAPLTGECSPDHVVASGSVSRKFNHYFDKTCFTGVYPVIGDDGVATDFGNGKVGIGNGPDQDNSDIVVIKRTRIGWPNEAANFEFRTELFNAFNTPQFSDPGTTYGVAGFGQITSLAVNPRVIQLALKYNF